eukprot:125914_1
MIVTNKGSSKDINCAYGAITVEPNSNKKYFWALLIQRNSGISIGLDEDIHQHINTSFKGNKITTNYSYYSKNGTLYSHNIPNGKQYGDWYYSRDIICMSLDGFTLSFCKLSKDDYNKMNGNVFNYPWKPVEIPVDKNKKYRMCVELTGADGSWFGVGDELINTDEPSCVQLLDYKCFDNGNELKDNNIEDIKEEKKEELYEYPTPNTNNNNKSTLKDNLLFLEKHLRNFNDGYNENELLNIYNKSPVATSLLVDNEINKLEMRLKACGKHLEEMKNYIVKLSEESKDEENECVVCMNGIKCYVAVPCGHLCLCEKCKDVIEEKCPICQAKCTVIKLFK